MKDGVQGTYGRYYDPDELVKECLKDYNFYKGEITSSDNWMISNCSDIDKLPGRVTFSGGECLLQMEELVPVIKALHDKGVHVAVETGLFVPQADLLLSLLHIDFFYVDVKILSASRCLAVEQGNLNLYLSNLHSLLTWRNDKNQGKPVVFRIPVIGSYTDDESNRSEVKKLIGKYKDSILKIELIKEHNLAESKYKSLNIKCDYHGVDDSVMEQYREELADLGIPTEICTL